MKFFIHLESFNKKIDSVISSIENQDGITTVKIGASSISTPSHFVKLFFEAIKKEIASYKSSVFNGDFIEISSNFEDLIFQVASNTTFISDSKKDYFVSQIIPFFALDAIKYKESNIDGIDAKITTF